MMELRTTEDLARIAAAGGGFKLNASGRSTDELARIAAAGKGVARITFTGLEARSTSDLARIAAAGKGSVCFEK